MEECIHKNPYYTVKRLRMLEYLMDKGFEPVKTIPDPINPHYKWWLFTNSPELEKVVTDYFAK
jgi:hypothetical protein